VQEDVRNPRQSGGEPETARPTRSVTQQETFFSPALRAAATPVPGALFFLPPVVFDFFTAGGAGALRKDIGRLRDLCGKTNTECGQRVLHQPWGGTK